MIIIPKIESYMEPQEAILKGYEDLIKKQLGDTREQMSLEIKQQVDAASKLEVAKAVTAIREQMSDQMRESLKVVTGEIQKDYRVKLLIALGGVFVLAISAFLGTISTATQKANEAVITLQNDIIAKQNSIMVAENSITISARKVLDAEAKMVTAEAQLDAAVQKLSESEKRLEAMTNELRAARTQYEQIASKVKTGEK